MISKKIFLEEAKKYEDKINIKKFEELYSIYENNINQYSNIDLVNEIIYKLFSKYSDEPLIPFNFLETPIGKVLLTVKYELVKDKVVYVDEAAKILGISKQAVLKKIKNGKLKAEKPSREWIIKEKDLKEYLNLNQEQYFSYTESYQNESVESPYLV